MNEEEIINILTTAAEFAILSIDDKGMVVTANPAVRKIFGKQEGEIEGQSLANLIPDVEMLVMSEFEPVQARGGLESFGNEEVRQAECIYLEALASMEQAGERYETQVHTSDGAHWIELDTCKLINDDEIVFAIIINDITRRKKNEQEIRQLNASLEQMVEERTAKLKSRTQQIKKVVMTCREELQTVNDTYQKMKERQMEIMESLESNLFGKVKNLSEEQSKQLKSALREELVTCMNLYSEDQITDQKFLLAIITLNELFDSETQESQNLKPGELSGTSQDEVDDLLDSLGI